MSYQNGDVVSCDSMVVEAWPRIRMKVEENVGEFYPVNIIMHKENKMKDHEEKQKEAYLAYHNSCGIEVGDTVKVMFKVSNFAGGWVNSWSSIPGIMNDYIGNCVKVVHDCGPQGFKLQNPDGGDNAFRNYDFPAFCLQIVRKKEDQMVELNGVKVPVSEVRRALKEFDEGE